MNRLSRIAAVPIFCSLVLTFAPAVSNAAPRLFDSRLAVRTVVSELTLPIGLAFIGPGDALVIEKNSGKVLRLSNGQPASTVLDLGVNNGSERGLLGIAVHPQFPANPGVYLFWSCRSAASPVDPFRPDEQRCLDANMFLPDTEDLLQVPLLGNRVDRFVWNGTTLTYDRNLITLRSFQNDGSPDPPGQGDSAQPPRGNHDGGVIRFGPDGKLYILLGDVGRRGHLQNLSSGPTTTGQGPVMSDDQFGGPEPDDAHFTGVILRLNDDGSTPDDNPFFSYGATLPGEVGRNIQKIFAYGIRNSFGMAFDPHSGNLWMQENGEDAYDELNLVEPGMNSGWIQIHGPIGRLAEYRQIEMTSLHHEDFPNLQQFRWAPANIPVTPQEALSRLFVLPESHFSDPEFSWKHVVPPAGIGFVEGDALGESEDGTLWVGSADLQPREGVLFRFRLTGNRKKIAVDDPRLEDRVADNTTFHELTECESILAGDGFGIVTEIVNAPGGGLWLVSLTNGAIYEITSPGRRRGVGRAN
jgi:glucose/arabinose dehydrogenase